jgi:hypothetical protein
MATNTRPAAFSLNSLVIYFSFCLTFGPAKLSGIERRQMGGVLVPLKANWPDRQEKQLEAFGMITQVLNTGNELPFEPELPYCAAKSRRRTKAKPALNIW